MANQDECLNGHKEPQVEAQVRPLGAIKALNLVGTNRGVQRWKMLSSVVKSKKYNECQTSNDTSPSSTTVQTDPPNGESKRLKVEVETDNNQVQFHTHYNMMSFSNDHHLHTDHWLTAHWNQELFPGESLGLRLRMLPKQFSLDEIAGFDNSGNVRLWPCEELLAYLCSFGLVRDRLAGSIVVELGAGMTALAGLIAAKHGGVRKIILSDGNERSVENIREIVTENFGSDPETEAKVEVRRIRWENSDDYADLCHSVETIICADCLFVPKYHQHLLNTLDNLLVLSPFQEQTHNAQHQQQHHHHHNHHPQHANSDSSSGFCDSSSSLSSGGSRSNLHYDSSSNLFFHSSFNSSSPSLSSSSASSSTSALFSSAANHNHLLSLPVSPSSAAQVFIVAPQRDTTLESFIRLVRLDGRFRCLVLDHFDPAFFSAIAEPNIVHSAYSNFSISFSDDNDNNFEPESRNRPFLLILTRN